MNYIIPIATIIITSEIIRNVLVVQNTKPTKVITFIIMILIDLVIYTDVYALTEFDAFVETVGFILFASMANNLLYNYVSPRYGSAPIIIYRLMTTLYVYIIPIVPNVYMFFRSILRTIYPYIIYVILDFTYSNKKKSVAYTDKRKAIVGKIIVCAMAVMLTMLISCQFQYGVLVIATGSMTGTINKGDAMIYTEYNGTDNIEVGQIIIFKDDARKVIHRVIDVTNVNGQYRYITKGDANNGQDEGYRTKSDIVGLYLARVPYAGYPSLWLRDIFTN